MRFHLHKQKCIFNSGTTPYPLMVGSFLYSNNFFYIYFTSKQAVTVIDKNVQFLNSIFKTRKRVENDTFHFEWIFFELPLLCSWWWSGEWESSCRTRPSIPQWAISVCVYQRQFFCGCTQDSYTPPCIAVIQVLFLLKSDIICFKSIILWYPIYAVNKVIFNSV